MAISIIPFEPRYASNFRNLNLAWLERYFRVEDKDRDLLEQCEQSIIAPGGAIFFAEYMGSIAGCFAFIPLEQGVYELGKMAVNPQFQGKQIGQELLRFAIAHARLHGWKKIVLYSSTKLLPALHIYRKYGFRETALEKTLPYERSDIKMELILTDSSLK